MKIGVDASRYRHAEATGVEWYGWNIINGLIKEVSSEDELILYSREKIEGLPGHVKNIVLKAKRLWTLRALSKEMRKNRPDVLFVPSHVLPLTMPKRSVVTIHDVAFRYLKKSYSFAQYLYLDWSTNYAVRKASRIIVPSQASADDLIKFYKCPKEKLVVIPHGFSSNGYQVPVANAAGMLLEEVDDSIFEQSEVFQYFGIGPGLKYLLFVGRLESKKNLVNLVRAFAEFCKKYPDYKLVLAGKRGLGFLDILKAVDDLEIMDKVIMPGYITEQEKAALYKYCQFFVFPSLYEGFGFPILEAFCYRKPVLTCRISSMPEVAGEAAVYVDPQDCRDMANGLERLANGGEYVEGLVAAGLKQLAKFSWEKCTKETLKILKNG